MSENLEEERAKWQVIKADNGLEYYYNKEVN